MGDINPYLGSMPTQTTTDQQTLIRDSLDDRHAPTSRSLERSRIDPDGANRTIDVQQTYLRTHDGRLIRDVTKDAVYACRSCAEEDLHEDAVRSCDECPLVICRSCVTVIETADERIEFCPTCYENWRRDWLFSLSA